MSMTITETGRGFEVVFPYNPRIVQDVKSITGSYFRGKDKTWVVPGHREREIEFLKKKYNIPVEPVIDTPELLGEVPPMPELDVEVNLLVKPFPYQNNGIAYNRIHKKTIIGDQPGLGKTLQAIGTIMSFGVNDENMLNAGPGLIICPSTLKLNWQKEWKEVAGRRSIILSDSVKNTWHNYIKVGMCDVFITNYESLKKYFVQAGWKKPGGTFKMKDIPFKELIDLFGWVIVDESHKCKDGTTQQTKFVMGITKGKPIVLELTGTAVVNNPKDLIPQLHIIDRLAEVVAHIPQPLDKKTGKLTDWSGYNRFVNRYCDGGRGESNLKELNYRLTNICFYRREKKDVLKDLPEKMRQVRLCEITNRAEYRKAEDEFVNYLKEVKGCTDLEIAKKLKGQMMVKIGILKNISARGKIESAREYIDEVLEGGQKIVVFIHLKEIAREMKSLYPTAVSITGDDSMEERNAAIQAFQNNPQTNVIICSIKAAGVGITLTASSEVLFIEFPWTDADCEQCEDRTHRIGQDNNVRAGYLLGQDTIDNYCYNIILKKRDMANTISGTKHTIQEEIVDELLNLFNQR
jgi:SWI/SNF-related matrix-associated actin-dependent regulator of chromatin subfamily A-like protein 1